MSRVLTSILALLLLVACAAPRGSDRPTPSSAGGEPAAPKRITTAVLIEMPNIAPGAGGSVIGREQLPRLVNAGLSNTNDKAARFPVLAEALPTTDNGLWKVSPDGRMETVWKLKADAAWHDGTPFTAEDMVFTAAFQQNRTLPITQNEAYKSIDRVEATDPKTFTVFWKQPYIDADQMFNGDNTERSPKPKHLLAEPLAAGDVEKFMTLPFWTDQFVGTGPYRMQAWVTGSHVALEANPSYVLGKPRIDLMEVRFIPDPQTMLANILAGAVDVTLGKTISREQAKAVIGRWNGQVTYTSTTGLVLWTQHIELYQNPRLMGNVQFRRALDHALDRQGLIDGLYDGDTSSAAMVVSPSDGPEYQPIAARAVLYPHDPRRSAQLIDELGYTRGSDGFFRDGANEKLSVEIRTNAQDVNQKATLAVADYWREVGVGVDVNVVPPQLSQDRPYRAMYPAFELLLSFGLASMDNYHSSKRKSPENNWTGSYTGYSNPEYDRLVDRYLTTIAMPERLQTLGDVVHHYTDQVVAPPLVWDVVPGLASNRILNTTGSNSWNVQKWDVQS